MEKRRKYRKFYEIQNPKIWVLGNVIRKPMQNFRKLAQLDIPKNRGNCTMMLYILLSPKTEKTAKMQEIFRNSKNLRSREFYYEG